MMRSLLGLLSELGYFLREVILATLVKLVAVLGTLRVHREHVSVLLISERSSVMSLELVCPRSDLPVRLLALVWVLTDQLFMVELPSDPSDMMALLKSFFEMCWLVRHSRVLGRHGLCLLLL